MFGEIDHRKATKQMVHKEKYIFGMFFNKRKHHFPWFFLAHYASFLSRRRFLRRRGGGLRIVRWDRANNWLLSNWKEYDRGDSLPFSLWTKLNSFWFIIESKTITMITFLWILKESEVHFSECLQEKWLKSGKSLFFQQKFLFLTFRFLI